MHEYSWAEGVCVCRGLERGIGMVVGQNLFKDSQFGDGESNWWIPGAMTNAASGLGMLLCP